MAAKSHGLSLRGGDHLNFLNISLSVHIEHTCIMQEHMIILYIPVSVRIKFVCIGLYYEKFLAFLTQIPDRPMRS